MSALAAQPVQQQAPPIAGELYTREVEWAAFFSSLNDCKRFRLHEVEAELHDLFVDGQVDLFEVRRYLNSFGEGGISL